MGSWSVFERHCSIKANTINFGQKPFKFGPPDGYQPLNTANTRPVKVISRPDQYVGVTTYTGDSAASSESFNIGMKKPDLSLGEKIVALRWSLQLHLLSSRFSQIWCRIKTLVSNPSNQPAFEYSCDTKPRICKLHYNYNGFSVAEVKIRNSNDTNQSGQDFCWHGLGKLVETKTHLMLMM